MPARPKPIFLTLTELLLWSQFTASQPQHKHLAQGFTRHLPDHTPLIILNYQIIEQSYNQPSTPTIAPGQMLLLKKRHRQALRALAAKKHKPPHL